MDLNKKKKIFKKDPKRLKFIYLFIFLSQVIFSFCVERKIDVWKPRKRDREYFQILYQRRQNKTVVCRKLWKHRSSFSSSVFIDLITYLFIYFVGKDQINMDGSWWVHKSKEKEMFLRYKYW